MKKERNKETILKQLQKMPVIEVACQRSGIGRATYYRWRKEDPEFKKSSDEALAEGELLINDMSESQVINLIREKNWWAISFWLKHHHPRYSTKLEITGNFKLEEEPLTPDQEELVRQALKKAGLKVDPSEEQKR